MDVVELFYAALQCHLHARLESDPAKRESLHEVGAMLTERAQRQRSCRELEA